MSCFKSKEYRSEEEILFSTVTMSERTAIRNEQINTRALTTRNKKAGYESLTPNPQKAKRLRMQKYW